MQLSITALCSIFPIQCDNIHIVSIIDALPRSYHRVASALASDHKHVLNPDVDTPFEDEQDVVRRLLPYHVFLHPREDLEVLLGRPLSELRGYTAFRVGSGKGKRKATKEELVREEIRGE